MRISFLVLKCLGIFLVVCSIVLIKTTAFRSRNSVKQNYSQQNAKREFLPRNNAFLSVNKPVVLSGLSKKEIFSIRKKYVDTSIFYGQDYSPSEEVFGAIVDKKPWIAANVCPKKTGELQTEGPSEEARFICNPSVLVGIEFPFVLSLKGKWCTDEVNNIFPQKVSFDEEKKEITVVYQKLPFSINVPYFYTFNGVNARDFGYQYASLDTTKTTAPLIFTAESNISNSVISFENFIHLGGSCRVSGGCNNGSPRQEFLEFKPDNSSWRSYNYEIYVKLWKERPENNLSEADIYERIIILE